MKPLCYLVCLLLFFSSCHNAQKEPTSSKKIKVTFNRNIETVMILRAISDTDYFLKHISDTNKSRPMLFKARQYFAKYKDNPAVAETQRLLYSAGDIGGQLFQGVLYANELPETGLLAEPAKGYWQDHRNELEHYMQLLAAFYKEANVEGFFEANKGFYNGAVSEARAYVNDEVTAKMETYFGKENKAYYMYIMPLCPYGWGFSGTVPTDSGDIQYAVIAPVGDVVWDETKQDNREFGFGGSEAKAHYRELVVHEFVHSFITDVLMRESFISMIDQYDSLYTPLLDSVMGENGYSGWWSFVNEHLVRLGHIRVAKAMDKSEANELWKADVGEYKFVLLPDFEKYMKDYETNRDRYKSIDEFLPVLIRQFGNYNKDSINKKLSGI